MAPKLNSVPIVPGTVEGFPPALEKVIVRPAVVPRFTDWQNKNNRLAATVAGLEAAGLEVPDEVATNLASLVRLRASTMSGAGHARGSGDRRPGVRSRIAGELVAGRISQAEAVAAVVALPSDDALDNEARQRSDTTRRAADRAYRAAMRGLADHGAELLAACGTVVAESIEAQLAFSDRVSDPRLVERVEGAHAAASLLRGTAVAGLDGRVPRDCWRFRQPQRVHEWRLQHAGEIKWVDKRRSAGGPSVYFHQPGSVEAPDLYVIAQHPEWEPAVPTADEVAATLRRIAADLGIA
jgi:hypothetical protein